MTTKNPKLRQLYDYLTITLGLVMYAFGWTTFLLPYKIVTGGVTGIASIIYYASGFKIQYTYLGINVLLLVVALNILGWKFLVKTIYAIFMLSFLLWLFQEFIFDSNGNIIQLLGPEQGFMSLTIGACITGAGLAIVFLVNGSTGGTDIVAAIVNKYSRLSIGRVLIFCDFLIISSSYLVAGSWKSIVFGFVTMAIENYVLDYVMNARRESVQFMIFSSKYQEIAKAIAETTNHGVTILDGHGWYTGKDVKVLCILARKSESLHIFRQIKSIDPNAFVSQSSVIGVYGEGFDQIKVKVPKSIE